MKASKFLTIFMAAALCGTLACPALAEEETYINLNVVSQAQVIDDDSTNNEGGSGNPITVMDAYGVGYSSRNDVVYFEDVDFGENGAASAKMHFGYGADDGSVSVLAFYIDDLESEPVLETEVGFTGGWDIATSGWVDLDFAVPAGVHTIYMQFKGEKSGSLSELAFFEAEKAAEPETTAPETEPETVAVPSVTETPATSEETPKAPQTFDVGIAAVIASVMGLAGCAAAKKKH